MLSPQTRQVLALRLSEYRTSLVRNDDGAILNLLLHGSCGYANLTDQELLTEYEALGLADYYNHDLETGETS